MARPAGCCVRPENLEWTVEVCWCGRKAQDPNALVAMKATMNILFSVDIVSFDSVECQFTFGSSLFLFQMTEADCNCVAMSVVVDCVEQDHSDW